MNSSPTLPHHPVHRATLPPSPECAYIILECFIMYVQIPDIITMTLQEGEAPLLCPMCLLTFKNRKSLQQHMKGRCQVPACAVEDPHDLVVRGTRDDDELVASIFASNPSPHQLFKMCYDTGTALAGLYPLFFPTSKTPPILAQLGCVQRSYDQLQRAAMGGPVHLKKSLKIRLGDTLLHLSQNLIPRYQDKLNMRGLRVIEDDERDYVTVYHISNPVSTVGRSRHSNYAGQLYL